MTAPNRIWQPPLRRLTLGLWLVVAATAFEALAVATILPITVAELGDLPLYGWVFSAFMLSNLVGISVGGTESERVGPALLFVAGTLLFVAGLVLSGLASVMLVIVYGRILQGFGSGLLFTVAYATIARSYAVELQPRVLATLSSAWVVPGLIGPGVAAFVTEHVGWRYVFLGLTPLVLIASALVVPALYALPRAADGGGLGGGRTWLALQLGLGAGISLWSMSLERWELITPCFALGGVVAARSLIGLLPEGTWVARAGLPAAIASMALMNFSFFGTEAFVPLLLTRVRGAPVTLTGFALTAAALTWAFGAWLPIQLEQRVSRRVIIFGGLGLLGVGMAGVAALLLPNVPAELAIVAWAISGLGMGLAFTTLSAAILELGGSSQADLASASLQLAQVIGIALATGLGGSIVAARFAGDPPRAGLGVVDALMLAALGGSLLAARGVPNTATQKRRSDQPA